MSSVVKYKSNRTGPNRTDGNRLGLAGRFLCRGPVRFDLITRLMELMEVDGTDSNDFIGSTWRSKSIGSA